MPDGATYERELKNLLIKDGYDCIRQAGSRDIDLLAVINGNAVYLECKSSKKSTVYLKGNYRLMAQFSYLRGMAKQGKKVYWAIRYKDRRRTDKRDKWRFIRVTKISTPIPLRWDNGITYKELIEDE